MTKNDFLEKAEEAGRCRQEGDIESAGKIYAELDRFLKLGSYQKRLKRMKARKVFSGLGPDTVLRYLFDRTTWCMNACETRLACRYIHYYKSIKHDFSLYGPLDFEMSLNEIEVRRRLGDEKRAMEICDEQLRRALPHEQKARILIAKGGIQTSEQAGFEGINSLSEALGEAEASGNQRLIAKCYLESGAMLGSRYVALGLSLTWKALIIFEKLGLKEYIAQTKTRMATAYFIMSRKHGDERFIKEASRLVNEDINRNDFSHPGARYSFDRLKGAINNDLNLIESAMDFFESIHAESDVRLTAEYYIKTAISMNRRDLTAGMAQRYEASARRTNDMAAVDYIRSIDFQTCIPGWFDIPEKKELPDLLDVMDNIAYDEECFHLEPSEIRFLFPTHYQEGKFETVQMSDEMVRLYPCGLTPHRYYRGQSDRLEGKKCQPSLYRGLSPEEMFHERLCLAELENLLDSYPLTQIFARGGVSYKTPDGEEMPIRLAVDSEALGQHYGIKTDLLDITADKWVAAFFASTRYKDGKYMPVTEDGIGVMYVYNHIAFDEASDRLSAVGLQPFSRPGRQAGLVCKMRPDEDFNYMAHRVFFRHDPSISEFVFNYCNRSKRLFPEEILEDKVIQIKKSKTYSRYALNLAVERYYPDADKETIKGYLDKLCIDIQSAPPVSFTQEELTAFNNRWRKNKDSIFEDIIVRHTFIGPITSQTL